MPPTGDVTAAKGATHLAEVRLAARFTALHLLLNDRDHQLNVMQRQEGKLRATIDNLEAEKYALEDQVKGLQELAAPVPPAVDVEVGFEWLHPDDRAHVTRLTAERDGLLADKDRAEAMLKRSVMVEDFQALQSELTNALSLVRWFYTHANVHQVGTVMMDAARDFIAHQSAPAAKVCDCVFEPGNPRVVTQGGHSAACTRCHKRIAPAQVFGMNLVVDGNMPADEMHLVAGDGGTVKLVVNDGKARDV